LKAEAQGVPGAADRAAPAPRPERIRDGVPAARIATGTVPSGLVLRRLRRPA